MALTIFKPYIEHSNMEDFIKVPKFYMSLIACWPLGKSNFAWLYYLYSFFTAYMSSILFAISLTIGIYQSMGDLGEVADASYFFMTEMCFLTKFMLFTFKRSRFLKLLDDLEDPIFFSHTPSQNSYLEYWSKISRVYSHSFFLSCFSYMVFCAIFPMLDQGEENILPFKGWFPFDVKENLYNRGLVYFFQLFCLLFAILVNASLDLLPSIFMNVACAQIEILKENLENATDKAEKTTGKENTKENLEGSEEFGENFYEMLNEEANEVVKMILRKCINHHEAIITFLANVEDMFSTGMLVQFLESGITICITGLQLIVVPPKSLKFLTIILYLLALTFQISCYCWNGHQVTVQSSSIGDSCYNMDWYRCNSSVKKTIFIIMERCKRPIEMTAGGFFTLSIMTLTAILRSSYSYFAVLQRVYKE